MPIYEYICEECSTTFEKLILQDEEVFCCPHCESKNLSKLFSRFGLTGATPASSYESLPLYKSSGCGCTPGTCCCKG